MQSLFISYCRVDADAVKSLVEDIEVLGFSVWYDQELSGGQMWWDQILFLLSENPENIIEVFRSWIWQVMEKQTRADLLTSDSPVVRVSPMEVRNVSGVAYHLPISPRRVILIIDPVTNNLIESLDRRPKVVKQKPWIRNWNELQVIWSYR